MSKKVKLNAPRVPRELKLIEQECQQELFKAGQLQYQMDVLSDELVAVNERIRRLNHEGAARKQLDAQKPSESVKTEESSND